MSKKGINLISKEHALLKIVDNKDTGATELIIADLGSKNGVFVNDEPVEEPTVIKKGDKIYIGTITLDLGWPEVDESETTPPTPPEGPSSASTASGEQASVTQAKTSDPTSIKDAKASSYTSLFGLFAGMKGSRTAKLLLQFPAIASLLTVLGVSMSLYSSNLQRLADFVNTREQVEVEMIGVKKLNHEVKLVLPGEQASELATPSELSSAARAVTVGVLGTGIAAGLSAALMPSVASASTLAGIGIFAEKAGSAIAESWNNNPTVVMVSAFVYLMIGGALLYGGKALTSYLISELKWKREERKQAAFISKIEDLSSTEDEKVQKAVSEFVNGDIDLLIRLKQETSNEFSNLGAGKSRKERAKQGYDMVIQQINHEQRALELLNMLEKERAKHKRGLLSRILNRNPTLDEIHPYEDSLGRIYSVLRMFDYSKISRVTQEKLTKETIETLKFFKLVTPRFPYYYIHEAINKFDNDLKLEFARQLLENKISLFGMYFSHGYDLSAELVQLIPSIIEDPAQSIETKNFIVTKVLAEYDLPRHSDEPSS